MKFNKQEKIIILPSYDASYMDSISKFFNCSVMIIEDDTIKIDELVNSINESTLKTIIFADFIDEYRSMIPNIKNTIIQESLMLNSLASFSNSSIYNIYRSIIEFYDRDLISTINVIDKDLYETLKNSKYITNYINLVNTKKIKNSENSNTIGIISNDYDPNNNFYNILTAISMVKCEKVKLISNMAETPKMVKYLGLNVKYCSKLEEVMENNFVNLYCNFTNANPLYILQSMDSGIPCIVGNTRLFEGSKILTKYLVLNSDDDVNEIAEKIENVKLNRKFIIDEYRKKFSK